MNHSIDISLRPILSSDASYWGLLRKQVWGATYRGIYPDSMIDEFDYSYHLQKDLKKLKNPEFHCFFLCLHHEPVGYLTYSHSSGGVILHSLYLVPQAQKQGLGRFSIAHVKRYCREHDTAYFRLQCNPWNTNAMAFYSAMGGRIRRKDTGNPEKIQDSICFEFSAI